jgi:protein KRI1
LRSYILNEGWRDKTQMADFEDPKIKKNDKEDEERGDEMENYETAYNFRFEDPNAATITSHARNALAQESLRRKSETRKLARERKLSRKEEEKLKRKEEITALKQVKKDEILDRLRKAEFIGHLDHELADKIQKELDTEFIPDVYDKAMTKTFNEKYYDHEQDEMEVDPDLNVNLLKDRDFEESVEGDFEEEVQQNYK